MDEMESYSLRSCGRKNKPARGCNCYLCDKRREYANNWERRKYRGNDLFREKRLKWGRRNYKKNQLMILMYMDLKRNYLKENEIE